MKPTQKQTIADSSRTSEVKITSGNGKTCVKIQEIAARTSCELMPAMIHNLTSMPANTTTALNHVIETAKETIQEKEL